MREKIIKTLLMKISMLGLCIIFGLGFASNTLAETLLNQPPAYTSGYTSDSAGDQFVADNFVLGSEKTINQIILWGGYYSGNSLPAADNFTVIFHQNNSGVPGTILYERTGINHTERTNTGNTVYNTIIYQFTLNLPSPPTLPAGTYWVQIFGNTLNSDDTFLWVNGILDPVNGIPQCAVRHPGEDWYKENNERAVQLNFISESSMGACCKNGNCSMMTEAACMDTGGTWQGVGTNCDSNPCKQPPPTAIPTLSEWGMIIFSLLLAGSAIWMIRRRQVS